MERTSTVFDRLRKLETEGRPLHALIVDACDVGTELVRALEKIATADDLKPGHIAYLSKASMALIADRAAALAYADDGHTPDNGKAAA
jgi:hypothetical protein